MVNVTVGNDCSDRGMSYRRKGKEQAIRFLEHFHFSSFVFRVSFFNALGAGFAVGIPTFVDRQLTTHVRYGARVYPLGYWVLFVAPIVFILTYLCMMKFTKHKGFVSWVPLGLVIFSVLWNFKPEFPHMNVIDWTSYCQGPRFIPGPRAAANPHFSRSEMVVTAVSLDSLSSYKTLLHQS